MFVYIYVDDERQFVPLMCNVPASDMIYRRARTYSKAIHYIEWAVEVFGDSQPIYLDLDHDLGEEKTGYDICKYIVENQIPNIKYRIHSMNPVGRANMEHLLSHYGYEKF